VGGLMQDLRFAARTLRKSPGFTLVAALTLALGIGANTAIFGVLYGVLLRPLPYPEPQQLVGLSDDRAITYREFQFVKENAPVFESFSVWTGVGLNVFTGSEAERVAALRVSWDYFRTLGVRPARGRDFVAAEDQPGGPYAIILSHGLWERSFGADTSLVGRTITVDGAPYLLAGVLPASFRPPEPVEAYATMGQVGRAIGGGENLHVIGRLRAGLSVSQAQERTRSTFAAFTREFLAGAPSDFSIELYPLRPLLVADLRAPVRALFVAVGLVLLIACVNVANLVLSRAAGRSRELAVRVSLGATRGRLSRQLLTESMLLGLLGGGLGLLLADWALTLLLALAPSDLLRAGDVRLDGWTLLFTAAASVLTGAAFGLVSAWRASATDVHDALKEGAGRATAAPREGKVRDALVIAEVALSLMLAVGAGLLMRSIANLVRTDVGFDPGHVLAAEIWLTGSGYDSTSAIAAYYDRLTQRLEREPGVKSAAVIEAGIPLVQGGRLSVAVDGVYQPASISYRTVTPGYFRTMGIPIEQGRDFAASDAGGPPVVIVSESFARRFLDARALDRAITVGGNPPRVVGQTVGVVADVRQFVGDPVTPTAYLVSAQTPAGFTRVFSSWFPIHVVVRTDKEPAALRGVVERVVRETDARVPVGRVRTMDEILSGSVALRRLVSVLLTVFASLAAALAAIGIYGVMSYVVTQRRHEIGVRIALGAVPREVHRLVIGRGMGLAAAGIAIGLVLSGALTRLLRGQLYGVTPADPSTFLAVTVLIAAVALAACYLPARRAAKVDPIVALRSE